MAAKKKQENSENNEVSLDDLINDQFSDLTDLSKVEDDVKYYVDSGNYALNYMLSKDFRKGYPGGKISCLWGGTGTGKSMLPIIATKSTDWDSGLDTFDKIILVDSEGGGTGRKLIDFVGADPAKVRYTKISTLDCYRIKKSTGTKEELSDKDMPAPGKKLETDDYIYVRGLISFIKDFAYAMKYKGITNEKVCIIVDSISNIKSKRANVDGVADMGKTNQLLNNLFAMDTILSETNITVLLAAKKYTGIGQGGPFAPPPDVLQGGNAMEYNPSETVKLTAMNSDAELAKADANASWDDEKLRRKGSLGNSLKIVRATMTKSRAGTENRNCWLLLDNTYGLVRNSGLFQMLKDFDVIIQGSKARLFKAPGVFLNEDGTDLEFAKEDFVDIFSKTKEDERKYIELFQKKMEEKEELLKEQRMHINVSDASELEENVDLTGDAISELAELATSSEAEE